MSDRDGYDPFAPPPSQPGMSDPAPMAPQPLAQPGMGDVPPMPNSPYGYGTGAPYGAAVPAGSSQKNYLGVLALIFPFVFLSAVGIVMGHLGLSAVKRGTASNRGVALAGTIISWVFTVLTLLGGLLVAIGAPLYVSQEDKAHEAEATSDLLRLNVAVATHYVDHAVAPVVGIEGESYVIGDQTEAKSASVDMVTFVELDDFNYCIAVTYDGGKDLSISESGAVTEGGCPDADAQFNANSNAEADYVAFSELDVGDCIADPYDNVVEDPEGGSWIGGVTIVDCAATHYGEIYAEGEMVADAYVEDDIIAQADDLCYFAFEEFMGVGYEDSMYYYEPYYPSPQGWKLGDRETTCVVTSLASDTVGSLQGSGR